MTTKKVKHPKQAEAERQKTIKEKIIEADKLEKECIKKTPKILSDPKLLINTVEEIQKEVAGEEDTIIAEIIIATTRLVKGAIPESKNFFLSDKTGIGKDHATKKTLEVIIPKDSNLHVTKMSNEAFTYWHANEELWTWDDKVIHFEDITQSLLNTSTFKVMSSGGSRAVVVKDQKTIEIPINGKPVMILTSHHANPEDEALRRFPIGSCDETIEQTTRIFEKISKKYTKRNDTEPDYVFRFAIKNLKPYSVVIPFAELIQFFFPKDILMRTHYQRFLNYICASAVFHQYQREKTENDELIATPDDYMIARMVLIYTTSNPKMIPMSKEYRDLLNMLKENVEKMTINEIVIKGDKSRDWYYRHLPRLCETGLLKTSKKYEEKANKEVKTYQYAPEENPNAIPTWLEIGKNLEDALKKVEKGKENQENQENQEFLTLIKWFSDNKIKPRKPKKGGLELVFLNVRIPFYREVFAVFLVLRHYLRERDEKRFKKYYFERSEEIKEKEKVKPQKTIKSFEKKKEKDKKELENFENYIPKIIEIMKNKPKTEWKINDICQNLGISSLSARKEITSLLEKTVSDPKNKTKIQKVDENGLHWRLSNE